MSQGISVDPDTATNHLVACVCTGMQWHAPPSKTENRITILYNFLNNIFWYLHNVSKTNKKKEKEKKSRQSKTKVQSCFITRNFEMKFFPPTGLPATVRRKKKKSKNIISVYHWNWKVKKKIQNLLHFWSLSTIKWYYFLIFRILSPIWLRSLRANHSPLRSTCLQSTNDSSKQNFMLINTTFLLLTINAKEKFRG